MKTKTVVFVSSMMLACLSVGILAEEVTYNDTAKPTADEANNKNHQQGTAYDIDASFTKVKSALPDMIEVQNSNVAGDSKGVYLDPLDDNAVLTWINQKPAAGAKVQVKVEGRENIGAIYWVAVSPTGGSGPPGVKTLLWADVKDMTGAGTLILKDTNSGKAVGDDAAGDPAPPDTLGCDIAADEKGDITFSLNVTTGSYTWTIAPDVPGDNTGTWTQTPYEKTVNNIVPGEYTLTVTGAGGFERKIKFVVVKIVLAGPTEGQEFAMAMAGPTMPTVQLNATVTPAMTGLQYRFKVGNPETNRALEYVDAPATGYTHPPMIESPWGAANANTWNIDFGTDIYGGNVTHVTVSIRKANFEYSRTLSRSFYLVGGSLTGVVRNAYINGLAAVPAEIRTMTRAIAIQESGGTHYWPTGSPIGTASHNRYPLRERLTPGGGYGVMQLTSANLLNRDTIWNWKRNIDMSIAYITTCHTTATAWLNAHNNPPITNVMKRLEGYARYNGLPGYYYWKAANGPWTKWGYIAGPADNNFGRRDYNNDGTADAAGNPYNLTYWTGRQPEGENTTFRPMSSRYADQAKTRE